MTNMGPDGALAAMTVTPMGLSTAKAKLQPQAKETNLQPLEQYVVHIEGWTHHRSANPTQLSACQTNHPLPEPP